MTELPSQQPQQYAEGPWQTMGGDPWTAEDVRQNAHLLDKMYGEGNWSTTTTGQEDTVNITISPDHSSREALFLKNRVEAGESFDHAKQALARLAVGNSDNKDKVA
jgi:hypothetical protein